MLAWDKAPNWGKKKKKSPIPPSPIHPSARIARRYFPIWPPFFLPSSFTAEPGPRLFPAVLCFCRCLWQDLISDAVIVETVFLWPLWSLKLFSTAKEPFVTKISVDFLFSEFEISASEKLHTCSCPWMWWFLVPCYVWRQALKPNKIRSDLRVTANQIIFHTLRENRVAYIHD